MTTAVEVEGLEGGTVCLWKGCSGSGELHVELDC